MTRFMILTTTTALITAGAFGQATQPTSVETVERPAVDRFAPVFEVSAGFEHRFETSIDGGGDVRFQIVYRLRR